MSRLLIAFLACISFLPAAWAREDLVPGARYTSGRAAAMGDAYLPMADDVASSLFYNPAGLAKIRQQQFEPLNFEFYGNSAFPSTLGRNFYAAPSLAPYLPVLQKHTGTLIGMGAATMPSLGMRGFGFGVLLNSEMMGMANADGTVYHRSLYQLIPTVGFGVRLASGIVRLGYSLQWVNQASGSDTRPGNDPDLTYTSGLTQASAFSHNFGFALSLPFSMLPSFNVVARNVLGAHFTRSSLMGFARNSAGTPPDEPMSIDASFSLQPKIGHGSYLNLVFEYRDITNTSGMSIWGRPVAGMEFSINDKLYLRGGWRSGYPSAGFGIRRKAAQFAITWYAEEIGSGYHSLRDTKYLLHYQIGVF